MHRVFSSNNNRGRKRKKEKKTRWRRREPFCASLSHATYCLGRIVLHLVRHCHTFLKSCLDENTPLGSLLHFRSRFSEVVLYALASHDESVFEYIRGKFASRDSVDGDLQLVRFDCDGTLDEIFSSFEISKGCKFLKIGHESIL